MLPLRPSEECDEQRAWHTAAACKCRRGSWQRAEHGFSLPPRPPKQKRRQRTVYSLEQREVLESFFENNHYPSYDEREDLAARLNLQELQVQVWFKNRRAKQTRTQGAPGARQRGPKVRASCQGPGVSTSVPEPTPAAVGPGWPEDPVSASNPGCPEDPVYASCTGCPESQVSASGPGCPEDPVSASSPGFDEDLELLWDLLLSYDPMLSGGSVLPGGAGVYDPFGVDAAAEPSTSSHLQAGREPPQDAQDPVLAAPALPPAPASVPVCPEDSNVEDFGSDLDLMDLLSLYDLAEGPSP